MQIVIVELSDMQDHSKSDLVLHRVLLHLLPQLLHFLLLLVARSVHLVEFYLHRVLLVQPILELLCAFGAYAHQPTDNGLLVLLRLVQPQNSIVDFGVELSHDLLVQGLEFQIATVLLIILHILHNFHEEAVEVLEHEPEVGEILFLTFSLTECSLEIIVQEFIAIAVRVCAQDIIGHFYYLGRNCALLPFTLHWRIFLELRWHVLFLAQVRFTMDLHELFSMGNFLVFVEQRVLAISELQLKKEFAGHEHLTSNNNVQKIGLTMKNLRMLANLRIQSAYFFLDFVHEAIVFAFLCFLIASEIFIKFIQKWEQISPEFIQFLIHFGRNVWVSALQIENPLGFGLFSLADCVLGLVTFANTLALADFLLCLGLIAGTELSGISNDVVSNFVLLVQLAVGSGQNMGMSRVIMSFFDIVVEVGHFHQSRQFFCIAVDHIKGQLYGLCWGLAHGDYNMRLYYNSIFKLLSKF